MYVQESKNGSENCVDLGGVEPPVSAMRMRRITNCATGPRTLFIIPEKTFRRCLPRFSFHPCNDRGGGGDLGADELPNERA